MKHKAITVHCIAAIFMVLFIGTALDKLQSVTSFRFALLQSPLLGRFSGVLAYLVPVIELSIAFLLFIPGTRNVGLFGALVLMTIFSLYIGYGLLVNQTPPCACAGAIQHLTWTQHFGLNAFLTAIAAWAVRLNRRTKQQKQINVLLQ